MYTEKRPLTDSQKLLINEALEHAVKRIEYYYKSNAYYSYFDILNLYAVINVLHFILRKAAKYMHGDDTD